MKNWSSNIVAVGMMTIACCTSQRATAQDGPCDLDPDSCAAPRTWFEDFSVDPLINSPGDWQQRDGTAPLPKYENGKAELDGFLDGPWVILDSTNHFFEGKTTINIKMDDNPNDFAGDDDGAGWWLNADNRQSDGGYYAVYGVLQRTEAGEQEYRFGDPNAWAEWGLEEPDGILIPIADGAGIDATITVTPNGETAMADVAYSITDAETTHTGEFSIPPRFMPAEPRSQRWFTLFSLDQGWGVIDSVEVINEGLVTTTPGDLNGDGLVDGVDFISEWQRGYGTDYDETDLAAWEENYGAGAPAASAAVPEPSSLILLGLAVLGLLPRRRRASPAQGR